MRRYVANVLLPLILTMLISGRASAADQEHFFVVPFDKIEWAEDAAGSPPETGIWWDIHVRPYVVTTPRAETYVVNSAQLRGLFAQNEALPFDLPENVWLVAVRSTADKIEGQFFIPEELRTGKQPYRFTAAPQASEANQRSQFYMAKFAYCGERMADNTPGAAWFRHQARAAERELDVHITNRPTFTTRRFFGRNTDSVESTFALVSGGRAVSENLQLDRELGQATFVQNEAAAENAAKQAANEPIPLSSIEGITIREFDWKALTAGVSADPDPLAHLIPADQHGLFFPSFGAFAKFADEAAKMGAPILQAGDARAEDARTRERYERQLGLSLTTAARLLGPTLIRSVAITGGDLYLRTGSDVAVLFEAADPDALYTLLDAQITLAATTSGAAAVQGEAAVAYRGFQTPDRGVCSYLARVGDRIVVTNSLKQLERIAQCERDPGKSLAALPEYTFFRHRYPRSEPETAFAVLSDATIRRWCGPKWRIATSRRTRAAAVLAELEAEYLHAFVNGTAQPREINSQFAISDARTFQVNVDGLRSEQYGDLSFQTPINEMDFTHVTPEEAQLYRNWRENYQRNWRNAFDPIAIRFALAEDQHSIDLTVMPLINNSDYRWMESLTEGAQLSQASGDPHPESLLSWSFAIDPNNPQFRRNAGWAVSAATILGADPLSWIGKGVTVYIDDDPVWAELAQLRKEHPEDEINERQLAPYVPRLPIALHVEVASGLKLTGFLTALRAFIEQSAPGMTVWETRKHGEIPYVRVGPSDQAREDIGQVPDQLAIYYAASGKGLTLTLSEPLLKRALDRRAARTSNQSPSQPDRAPLLGESVAFEVDARIVEFLGAFYDRAYQERMQRIAWNNLLILNEWKRLFPDQDPVELHETYWTVRLRCPGGGEFRWNEQLQTMESTVYGCPAAPRTGPSLPEALQDVKRARFGLTFEENGLRARAELNRAE